MHTIGNLLKFCSISPSSMRASNYQTIASCVTVWKFMHIHNLLLFHALKYGGWKFSWKWGAGKSLSAQHYLIGLGCFNYLPFHEHKSILSFQAIKSNFFVYLQHSFCSRFLYFLSIYWHGFDFPSSKRCTKLF